MKNIVRRILNVLNLLAWLAAAGISWADKSGFTSFLVILGLGLSAVLTLNYVLFGRLTIWNEIKREDLDA